MVLMSGIHADFGEFHYESRSLFTSSMVTVDLDGSLL